MLKTYTMPRNIVYKRDYLKYLIIVIPFLWISAFLFAQESAADSVEITPTDFASDSADQTDTKREDAAPLLQQYRITAVNYAIKGMTRQYPLEHAVPIDTVYVFDSEEALQRYLAELEQRFKNIRTIQSVKIEAAYGEPDSLKVIPVTLAVAIVDTWNFIAVPYPSFDSNTGFKLKLKMQDFNFVGTLQPLKADIVYRSTETGRQVISSSVSFGLPFKTGILDMLWLSSIDIVYAFKEVPKMNIATGVEASYTFNKHVSVAFGIMPELILNDRSSLQASEPEAVEDQHRPPPTEDEPENKKTKADEFGPLYAQDRYYFKTTFFVRAPVMITEVKNIAPLIWTPSLGIGGNWAFDGIQADDLKNWTLDAGHSLALSRVNWIANFRKGFSVSFGNVYSYRFYNKKKTNIGFTVSATGYYPFLNRVGVYGRMQFFYHLFNAASTQAGAALRGILNKRIDTDTGFAFNLDIPIRIASLDFQAITGVDWVRIFNCDVQLVPFLDMAFVHDKKTGRYFHPADGWYAGGMEMIVYSQKMRSIYVRASIGLDLAELKNVPGLNKLRGRAKRDGEAISEIFIGIGVHY